MNSQNCERWNSHFWQGKLIINSSCCRPKWICVCVCVCVCVHWFSFLPSSFPPFFLFFFFFFFLIWGLGLLVLLKKKKKEPKKQKTKKKTHIKTESSRMHQNNRFLDFCVYFYKKKKKTVFLRYCHIFLFE